MADDTKLTIRFEDAGGSGTPIGGGAPPPIGGGGSGGSFGGSPTNYIYAAAGSQVFVINGNVSSLPGGMGKGGKQAGAAGGATDMEEAFQSFRTSIGFITAAFQQAAAAVGVFTILARGENLESSALRHGDVVAASLARKETRAAVANKVAGAGAGVMGVGMTTALAGAASANPVVAGTGAVVTIVGAAISGISSLVSSLTSASAERDEKAFAKGQDDLMERLGRVGQYGGPIAGALARRRAIGMGRDIAEAQANGIGGAEYISAQTEYETLQQQLAALQNAKDMKSQMAKLNEKAQETTVAIEKLRKEMGPAADEIIKSLKQGGESALDKILDRGIKGPDDSRPSEYEAIRKLRAEQWNRPVFGGM